MRIYYGIIIGFIVICCLSFTTKYYASTWAGTASNQTVSRNALADAVANTIFYQKAAFTGSTRQVTKAEAAAWVYLDETASPFAGKASNQLVIKTDLVAVTPIYITIAASYDGLYGLSIQINTTAALPAEMVISFDWCTNTTADGNVPFTLPSGFSGSTSALANCSISGSFAATYASGNVVNTTFSVVNDFHVKGSSLTVTISDNSRPYLISYPNVDNACSNAAAVVDECVNCGN